MPIFIFEYHQTYDCQSATDKYLRYGKQTIRSP